MTILPLVASELVTTNVTDVTAFFNNLVHQNYPIGTRYQENNNIYENMANDIVVPAYSAEATYTVGQIVFKDSKVSKCTSTSGLFPKQPEEYASVDTSFDDSVWGDRYMKIADIPSGYSSLGVKKYILLENGYSSGTVFSYDGTKMYTISPKNDRAYQWTLSTAWDISTASYGDIYIEGIHGTDGSSNKLIFSPDGLKMFELSRADQKIYQWTLSTAWDISTASYGGIYKTTQDALPHGIAFSSDGTKMYEIAGGTYHKIYQWTLSTAWSLSTATYGGTYKTSQGTYPTGIAFSSDGTKMYELDTLVGNIYQWTLSTAWSLSTATYGGTYILSQSADPNTLAFSSDGTKMFLDGGGSYLYYYILSTAWDISTAKYSIIPFSHTENRGGVSYTYSITELYGAYTFTSTRAGVSSSQVLTKFTELNDSSVEEKAYTGSNGTWLAKTLVIRPTAIYIRTSVDKSIEYKTLTDYQFSVVTSPTELTGFSFIEKTNPYKPFDNKSYTVATIDNTMTYKIKALGKMDAVVLAHMKGALVTVKFYDSTDTLQSEIVDYVIDGSIDERDEHEHSYTTEIFYNMVAGVRTTIDTGGYIEIILTDTNLELGTLSPCLSIDAGFLDLEMELSINDYSPYEVGIGGVVDYIEGIATINANLTFYEKITNFDKSARRMIELKRQVVAIDGGSSLNRPSDAGIALFNSTKLLGRMDKISIKTVNKNNQIDKWAKITTNILEVS